ncbi:MAG: ABC transporter ATP-binding protein [Planctomycetota bacterium]|jgi:ATP-binding cassette subfamily B protein
MPPSEGKDPALLRRVLREARPFGPSILAIVALDLVATPLALLMPVPLRVAVDSVVGDAPAPAPLDGFASGGTSWTLLLVVAGLLVAITLASQAQALAAALLRTSVGERMTLAFRARLFRHAQRLSFRYHDRHGTGDPTYRILYDSQAVRSLVIDGVLPFVGATVTLASMLYVTFRINAQLAAIALTVTPALFLLSRAFRHDMRQRSRKAKRLESQALGVIQEVLGSLRVVKAFVQEHREQERFETGFGASMRARLGIAWAEGRLGLALGLTMGLGTAAVLLVGVRNVQAGELTLGGLLQVMAYLGALYAPLRTMSRKVAGLAVHMSGAERAFALLDERPDVEERPDARALRRARGVLGFERVDYAYDGGRPVLRDVNLHIEAGTRVGLAGETGAGKTTLAGLLLRFADPTAGRILLDGTDLRELRLADLRRQFSVVPQDTVLFSTSIQENIAYARPDASRDDVVAAARAANAHAFIEAFPDGYATLVGERGMRLSGGERQRIAIARAFLMNAPILVLDEPTSALDEGTESEVLEAMDRLMRDRTTLIIAHRSTLLDACDEVWTLRDGALTEAVRVAL